MEKGKILVVDDDLAVCLLVSVIVEKLGHKAIIATDGYQAIRMIEKDDKIFLVITDIHMPLIDGLILIEKICSRFPYLKIIAMSSEIDEKVSSVQHKVCAIVDKLDLFHSLTSTIKKIEGDGFVKDLDESFGFTT